MAGKLSTKWDAAVRTGFGWGQRGGVGDEQRRVATILGRWRGLYVETLLPYYLIVAGKSALMPVLDRAGLARVAQVAQCGEASTPTRWRAE